MRAALWWGMTTSDLPDPEVQAFWERSCRALNLPLDTPYDAWDFGDSATMADELLELVLARTKRATAGLVEAFRRDGEPVPEVGDLSVILDGAGRPRCVIETTSVEVKPFHAVDAVFAATEGEGDGSLRYWRDAHRRFFGRECARLGLGAFREGMAVVCETFELRYREG